LNKKLLIIPLVLVIGFGAFMLVTDMMPNISLEPKNTDEKSKLKIKAERLQRAHNDLVNYVRVHDIPDPRDYGYDLDVGFTDNTSKNEWCTIVHEDYKKWDVMKRELDESLKQLENESNKPLQLQEFIVEDKEMLKQAIGLQKDSEKMIIAFDC